MSKQVYKKNVVLIDFDYPKHWDFLDGLKSSTDIDWQIIASVGNHFHGSKFQNLRRYMVYYKLPKRMVHDIEQYNRIIAWQQFFGIFLARFIEKAKIKKEKAPYLAVMEFIYKPKRGLIGKIYYNFMCNAVHSEYIDKIFVFSKSEQEYYAHIFNTVKERFTPISLAIEDEYENYKNKINDDGKFLSVGRSNRDYEFLINLWKDQGDLEIICDSIDPPRSKNITLYKNCYNEKYLEKLASCHAVIIPLKDEEASSGELVILQSMMFGKPVIVTKNHAAEEYITDGRNGIVIEKNEKELNLAINKLCDSRIYQSISKEARRSFLEKYNLYIMGINVGNLIRSAE